MAVHVNTKSDLTDSFNNGGTIISSSGARSAASEKKGTVGNNDPSGNQLIGSEVGAGESRDTALKALAMERETISPERIFMLMENMIAAASIHELSRGTHGAALADRSDIFVTREDIGRHNCLDMLSGHTLLHDIDGADKVLLRTGRVSSEIVHKVWRMGIPVVLSLSVPTSLAISRAGQAGITLVGAIRAPSLTVYTHGKRIRES
jgi:FdhD protein